MLKKKIKPITSAVLSKHLKHFLELDLIIKEVIADKPLRVEYSLSEKGKLILASLLNVLNIFNEKKEDS